MKLIRMPVVVGAVLVAALTQGQAQATTNAFNASGTNNDWLIGSNWSLGHAPLAGEDVVIESSYANAGAYFNAPPGTHQVNSIRLNPLNSLSLDAADDFLVTTGIDVTGSGGLLALRHVTADYVNIAAANTNVQFNGRNNFGVVTSEANITHIANYGYFEATTIGTLSMAPNRIYNVNSQYAGLTVDTLLDGLLRNNDGIVAPGGFGAVGDMTLAMGTVYQDFGTLEIDIASAASFDRIFGPGHASIGRNLQINFLAGYVPTIGTTFDVGVGGSYNVGAGGLTVTSGFVWEVVYSPTTGSAWRLTYVGAAAVPEPATGALVLAALGVAAARTARSRGRTRLGRAS